MKRGFSLVELIVVIAIIAILAAIAVPSFVNYKQRVAISSMMASLEQFHNDYEKYFQTHGYYPTSAQLGFTTDFTGVNVFVQPGDPYPLNTRDLFLFDAMNSYPPNPPCGLGSVQYAFPMGDPAIGYPLGNGGLGGFEIYFTNDRANGATPGVIKKYCFYEIIDYATGDPVPGNLIPGCINHQDPAYDDFINTQWNIVPPNCI